MNKISFPVAGWPPAKNEALSMFGVGHSHAPRVRMLLAAAQTAIANQSFQPLKGAIGLEVILYAPANKDPWDATNYLGGIADVLQDKSRVGIPLDHLGDLAHVALYRNDRQIREVHYHQMIAEEATYQVRIWPLTAE